MPVVVLPAKHTKRAKKGEVVGIALNKGENPGFGFGARAQNVEVTIVLSPLLRWRQR